MAELIDKSAFKERFKEEHKNWFNLAEARAVRVVFAELDKEPTTTEAEIRAMAIDEFAKEIEAEYDNDACPNVTDYLDYKISLRDLFRIADQLKEEQ